MAVAMPEFPGHVPTGESELAANVRQDMLLALMGLQQRAAATFTELQDSESLAMKARAS